MNLKKHIRSHPERKVGLETAYCRLVRLKKRLGRELTEDEIVQEISRPVNAPEPKLQIITWNGIAPFKSACRQAPGYEFYDGHVSSFNYVRVTKICPYCEQKYTRRVKKTHAERLDICGKPECVRLRGRKLWKEYTARQAA